MGIFIGMNNNKMVIILAILGIVVFPSYFLGEKKCNAASNATSMTAAEMRDDAKIKAVWAGMRAALKANDINRALTYFSDDSKDTYKNYFNLIKNDLDVFVAISRDIEADEFGEDFADYHMLNDDESGSLISLIRFVNDERGNWHINFF